MNGANVVQNGAMKKVNSLLFSLLTFCFVPPQGLEPWTPTLRVSCSTN